MPENMLYVICNDQCVLEEKLGIVSHTSNAITWEIKKEGLPQGWCYLARPYFKLKQNNNNQNEQPTTGTAKSRKV